MRAHVIRNGVVENTIEIESLNKIPELEQFLVDAALGGKKGDLWDGETFTEPLPPPPTLDEYIAAMEAVYDGKAHERRYDDRYTCALRAGYVSPFQAEGLAFATWMDTCNAIGYTMLYQFQQGLIPQPTIQDVLDALPELVWP
jgi:hypothetical protein